MDLTQLLLSGSLAGLVSVLVHTTLWSALAMWNTKRAVPHAEPPLPETILHMLAGVVLAFIFWLSWGLAAITDGRWWVRGLYFGGLAWLALTLPTIVSLIVGRIIDARTGLLVASRWATTAVSVGLTCAWSWH
ncbi:MAG: hypothetical protein C0P74_000510 [Gammaproteobacteria bacterium]|nr:hypothetical protein [Gammaproteobacteria bacterium]